MEAAAVPLRRASALRPMDRRTYESFHRGPGSPRSTPSLRRFHHRPRRFVAPRGHRRQALENIRTLFRPCVANTIAHLASTRKMNRLYATGNRKRGADNRSHEHGAFPHRFLACNLCPRAARGVRIRHERRCRLDRRRRRQAHVRCTRARASRRECPARLCVPRPRRRRRRTIAPKSPRYPRRPLWFYRALSQRTPARVERRAPRQRRRGRRWIRARADRRFLEALSHRPQTHLRDRLLKRRDVHAIPRVQAFLAARSDRSRLRLDAGRGRADVPTAQSHLRTGDRGHR